MTGRPFLRASGVALALAAIGVASAVFANASLEAEPARTGGSQDVMAIFDPAVALMPEGRTVPLAEATELAGFPILRPLGLAEPPEVWFYDYGDGVREVALRYGEQGIVVHLGAFPQASDPASYLRSKVEGLPLAYTTTIAGYPAAVIPYDPERSSGAIDVVCLVAQGVEVTFYGDHRSNDVGTLLSAAASLGTEA
ncbi:hypothetical protein HRbin12_00283 [bacterium HR12]|nr:hypothetical protein HRbin12_00283 [bacterium HR12]